MRTLCLNQKSCKNLSLQEFLRYAKDFYGVELDADAITKFLSNDNSLKDLRELMSIYSLKSMNVLTLTDFSLNSETNFKLKTLPQLEKMMRYAYKLECNLITVQPSSLKDNLIANVPLKRRIIKKTRERIERIRKIASDNDLKIGFEYTASEKSSIGSLKEAIETVQPLEYKEHIGYIIDTFNFRRNVSEYGMLEEISEFIYLIQICDFQNGDTPREKRIFPGLGDFDFHAFFTFLRKIGYRNTYSLETAKVDCSQNLYKKFYRIF